jgi:NADPH2:quinone reductase
MRAIAVYSDADRDAPHVKDADQAVAIGPAPARESYLNIDRILTAAREAGADAVIGYDCFAERVRELTGGEGVAAVYDGVGRTTFDESMASLRRRGYLVLFGQASGPVPPVDPSRLAAGGGLFLTRPMLPQYTATRQELLGRAGDVFEWIRDGTLEVRIGGRYSLEEARKAQEDLMARKTTGKLLLLPRS